MPGASLIPRRDGARLHLAKVPAAAAFIMAVKHGNMPRQRSAARVSFHAPSNATKNRSWESATDNLQSWAGCGYGAVSFGLMIPAHELFGHRACIHRNQPCQLPALSALRRFFDNGFNGFGRKHGVPRIFRNERSEILNIAPLNIEHRAGSRLAVASVDMGDVTKPALHIIQLPKPGRGAVLGQPGMRGIVDQVRRNQRIRFRYMDDGVTRAFAGADIHQPQLRAGNIQDRVSAPFANRPECRRIAG
jgi:hypothetical protein